MTNLAHELNEPQGELVQFPRKERQVMSNNDEGFTPLPNFICDEGYLAELSGDAIKCVVFLNRHINGFHIDQKSMSESLVMKITGIKDNRTIRKYMSELAKFKLIKIIKENGKSNKYQVTFDERLPVKPVASHVPSTSNAGTSHVTTPVASHVPTTSDMPCHPVKEIDLKENIKEEEEAREEKFEPQNRQLGFIEYFPSDRQAISFKNLCQKYFAESDFFEQAKITFPNHTAEQIQSEFHKLAQWSLSASSQMPQKWMNVWLSWMQKVPTAQELAKRQAKKSGQSAKKPHRFGQNKSTIRDVGGSHE